MIEIKKNNPKYNAWLKKRNQVKFQYEVEKRKRKKEKYRSKRSVPQKEPLLRRPAYKSQYQATAPHNFSIINNPEESVEYFDEVIGRIRGGKKGISIYFNMEFITELTIDSVMYLLAVIKNIKRSPLRSYYFSGNRPKNKNISKLLDDSGFFNYVRSSAKNTIETSSEQIQIKSGNEIDRLVAKEICDFVNKKFGTTNIYTKFLYNMIMELMANTVQHAYSDNSFMMNYWYIFVRHEKDKIKFTFLDTGSGIPQTIRRYFFENVIDKDDNKYILSALEGEFRTQTRKGYRGKGLPKIYNYYKIKTIDNLSVISDKGYCNLGNNIYDIQHVLHGTLFYWEISKESARRCA